LYFNLSLADAFGLAVAAYKVCLMISSREKHHFLDILWSLWELLLVIISLKKQSESKLEMTSFFLSRTYAWSMFF